MDPLSWQALPGIGPYTAAAISSIAFNYPIAVVDGNLVRILARLTKEESEFKNNNSAVKHFHPVAASLLTFDVVSFQVKGEWLGSRRLLGARLGAMSVSAVYAGGPPIPGRQVA